ncbi:MAG: C4-dicarboxylate ABC transporter [Opitutaceae bacterium]|nr:C4-dicarboxylate ABC transporter [Opitutaceae bacterium]
MFTACQILLGFSSLPNFSKIMRPLYCFLLLIVGFIIASCAKQSSNFSGLAERIEKKRNLRVVCFANIITPIVGEMPANLGERINTVGAGKLAVKLYNPDELVGAMEILDVVSEGKVDAGFGAAGFWAGNIPSSPIFSSIPFGPNANEYLAWFYEGNGMKLYQEMYDSHGFNVKVLLAGMIPPETSGWFTKEINSLDDLEGLKMRFFGFGGEVMKQFGVAVRLLPPGEIYPALEKGVIDATEYAMPSIDEGLGFHKIAKYNYFPGWHQQATTFELIINKDVWNSLSESQQAILEQAGRANLVYGIAKGDGSQGPAMKRMAERGVEQRTWPPQVVEAFKKTWEELAAQKAEDDPFFKKVWEDLQQFRAEYKEWGDRAYIY